MRVSSAADEVAGRLVVAASRNVSMTFSAEHHVAHKRRLSLADNLEILIQSIQDYAIFMLDSDGRIAGWNRGAERVTGYASDDVLGAPFDIFYPEEAARAGAPRHALEIARREGRFEEEAWQVCKDASRFWADIVITALRDDSGGLVGYLNIIRDLTARRDAELQSRQLGAEHAAHVAAVARSDELAELNRRLEEQALELEAALNAAKEAREAAERAAAAAADAYRELDQFAYIASHDLKAPLRGIANIAQWLQEDLAGKLDGQSAEHLRLLQNRVYRMDALIDAILAYSRAGRTQNAAEPVDTGALIRDVVEMLDPPPQLRLDLTGGFPTVEAERIPLQQVFMNLIGNAIKFSRGARSDPEVRVGWRDLGDAIEFSIGDNGPGIAPQFHERVWGMFQTLAARDKVEGTGIGLAIVRKIVESRGGSVAIESAPGQGATFRFRWPKRLQNG